MNELSSLVKKRVIWWVIGSLGFVGMAIVGLVLLVAFVLLGVVVSSSDSSMTDIPIPHQQAFDIPSPLLPIYINAENEAVSWARLAAIHKVTTDFDAEKAKRMDRMGGLGFPRLLWETYKIDGDEDGEIQPDNPHDAIFSLANYLQESTLDTEALLQAWFLNSDDVAKVHAKEAEYSAMLIMTRNWLWPVIGYTNLSNPYGFRTDPVTREQGVFHDGIDIPAPRGTPIVAIQNGSVIQVFRSNSGYGNTIRLQHDGSVQSYYAHLSKIGVHIGQQVLRGEVIGWIGSSGKSTGPHLHLTMVKDGQSINPQNYFLEHSE